MVCVMESGRRWLILHTRKLDQGIARASSSQHGVFTRAQAFACGGTANTIRRRIRTGRWERLYPKVYRLAGTPVTWQQRAIAATFHLGSDVALSFRAAASLRGLPGFRRDEIEVTVKRNRNRTRQRDVTIHWTTEPIPKEDVTIIDGIPVTSPARTLLDLASVEPEDVIEQCLDDALRRRLVSLAFLDRWLEDPRRRRHRGRRVLRDLVDARMDHGVTDSQLESKMLKLIRDAGLPMPVLQHVVCDGARFVGRVDFAYPDKLVAIEADSLRFHDGRAYFDRDRMRGNEIVTLGWRLLRVTSDHLTNHPDDVIEWIRRGLE